MRFDHKQFFDGFRPWFGESGGGSLRADHVANLEFLLGKFESSEYFSADVRRVAYAIATMHIETFVPKTGQRYEPVTEFGPRAYFNKYDIKFNPSKARSLGNVNAGDGFLFRGRGDVQITGRDNYVKFGIADTPDKALDADFAFHIMERGMQYGLFTGYSLNHFIHGDACDYVNARRVINRLARAKEIAEYASSLEQILSDALLADLPATDLAAQPTDSNGTPATTPTDSPDGTPTVDPPPANPGDVVVEKETNVGFFARIKIRLTGWLTGLGGLTGLQQYKAEVDGLGLPGAVIEYVLMATVLAFFGWLLFEAVRYFIIEPLNKRSLTNALVAANATPTNVVTVACPEDLAKYQAAGYKVVTRQ